MIKRNRIKALAKLIQNRIPYTGEIIWDTSKPNSTPRKLLDISKIEKLGWKSQISLEEEIRKSYEWFLENN